jgi:hypothetical protein
MSLLTTCKKTYELTLPECLDTYTIANAGLAANTTYLVVLIDKFSKVYYWLDNSDGDGNLLVNAANWPKCMLNHNAGAFKLAVYQGATQQTLTFCGKTYDSVTMTFVEYQKDVLPINGYITCQE